MTDRPHCLVVGVGAGTGLACVRRFVDGGYKVSMIARHAERLQSFAGQVEHTTPYPADISGLDGYRATLKRIIADQGGTHESDLQHRPGHLSALWGAGHGSV